MFNEVSVGGGLRLITSPMPSTRTAAVTITVGTGSRFEPQAQSGFSHFIEHLLFRGSQKYDSAELDRLFDRLGGEMTAMTGRESTVLHNRVASDRFDSAFDAMLDMAFSPLLADVDAERSVILEEIAMVEDDPAEMVFELLSTATFGTNPVGRPVLGDPEVIAQARQEELVNFHRLTYRPANTVVSVAGDFDEQAIINRLEQIKTSSSSGSDAPLPSKDRSPTSQTVERDTEQTHICIGSSGPGMLASQRYELRVLDQILGGGASSRLFTRIREQLGLAYDTHSFVSFASDLSELGVYVATRPENATAAAEELGNQVRAIRSDAITEDEFENARASLLSRIRLASESVSDRSLRLAADLTVGRKPLGDLELEAKVESVAVDDVRNIAESVWAPEQLSAACIGPSTEAAEIALAAAGCNGGKL